MKKETLKRLGAQLRREIVPLEDLPFPMREALRKLAEKHDDSEVGADIHDLRLERADREPSRRAASSSRSDGVSGSPVHPFPSSLSKR